MYSCVAEGISTLCNMLAVICLSCHGYGTAEFMTHVTTGITMISMGVGFLWLLGCRGYSRAWFVSGIITWV